ncbi:MAG: hypothetical protein K9M10_01750 [Candidatus Pacebacteria bacterium]|nr:hypothetical protein [Candidatus Paceibacterota bacterium]MCF7857187.1 hypothetical protein [Candidatus Paceibacterota bacterium]
MNIHPLFVHFPIGILTLYFLLEVSRLAIITRKQFYFEFKAVLVVIGTVSIYLAVATGDMAEELIHSGENSVIGANLLPLVEQHSLYAGATITIFSIIAASYLFEYCKKFGWLSRVTKIQLFVSLSKLIQKYSVLLAVIGMVFMIITGSLGASLVYGPEIDPIVTFMYTLFVQ